MKRRLLIFSSVSSLVFATAFVTTQTGGTVSSPLPSPAFHHLHMNSVNPSAAIDALMKVYRASSKVHVAGFDGIKSANGIALLFTKVNRPPPAPGPDRVTKAAPQTAFWHHVWSAPDARSILERLRQDDPAFDTTKFIPQYTSPAGETVDFSSDTFSGFLTTSQVEDARRNGQQPTHKGGYFNWYGPDDVVMETTDAGPEAYRIVGMFQEQPFCAVIWYQKHLNAADRPASVLSQAPTGGGPQAAGGGAAASTSSSEANCTVTRGNDVSWPSTYRRGHYRVPPAQSVYFDDVQLRWYMNQEERRLVSTRGQLLDHIGLSVTDFDAWMAKLRREHVKFLGQPYAFGDTRAVLIEGPSREALELVEKK